MKTLILLLLTFACFGAEYTWLPTRYTINSHTVERTKEKRVETCIRGGGNSMVFSVDTLTYGKKLVKTTWNRRFDIKTVKVTDDSITINCILMYEDRGRGTHKRPKTPAKFVILKDKGRWASITEIVK